jgi:hypothetical protein
MIKALLLVALGLVAVASVANASECDALTILKVKAQWDRAYAQGHSREHFAEAVWRTVFNLSPAAKERFKAHGADDTSSGKFRAFALRTLGGVEMAVTFLDQPESLKAELEHLHKLQEERHIPDELIDVFIKALGYVVPAQLGRCWDREAWKACFTIIAEGIKGH